jgi:hypothetical protein
MKISTKFLVVLVSALALTFVHRAEAIVGSACINAAIAIDNQCVADAVDEGDSCKNSCDGNEACITNCDSEEQISTTSCAHNLVQDEHACN